MDAAAQAAVGAARSLHQNLPAVTDGFGLAIESAAVILFEGNPPRFRNSENMKAGNESVLAVGDGYGRSSLHNPGERGEDLTDFTRVFKPVKIALTVAVVAHHIGQAERT
jgi:hypothetical protein